MLLKRHNFLNQVRERKGGGRKSGRGRSRPPRPPHPGLRAAGSAGSRLDLHASLGFEGVYQKNLVEMHLTHIEIIEVFLPLRPYQQSVVY